jgi:hypothetical protein
MGSTNMTDREHFDSLMKLADFRFARWRDRRKYEWRTSAGLWAVLAAAVIYLKPNSYEALIVVGVLLIVAVLGHAWFWVRLNWVSGEMDIRTAFYFAEHAEAQVLQDTPNPGKRLNAKEFEKEHGGWEFMGRGVCQFQVAATGLLACTLFAVLAFGISN